MPRFRGFVRSTLPIVALVCLLVPVRRRPAQTPRPRGARPQPLRRPVLASSSERRPRAGRRGRGRWSERGAHRGEGNRRVEVDAIKAAMLTKAGAPVTSRHPAGRPGRHEARLLLRRLRRGEGAADPPTLVVTVVEKPSVQDFKIEGTTSSPRTTSRRPSRSSATPSSTSAPSARRRRRSRRSTPRRASTWPRSPHGSTTGPTTRWW